MVIVRQIVFACCVIAAASNGVAGAQSMPPNAETVSTEQMQLARYVLTGFRDSRGRLRTGVFRLSGSRISKDPRRHIDHAGEIEGFVAVDFERNWFRFERQEPSYKGDPVGGRYIKQEDMAVSRQLNSRQTSILKATSEPNVTLGMFDIRTAGLANNAEFERNVGLDKLLDEFLPVSNLLEAVKEKQVYRLSWETGSGALKRSVWFDESSGFSPVRLETRYRAAAADSAALNTCDATWLEKDGVWVPETLSMGSAPRVGEERRITYAFDWTSVNQPVDDQVFAVAALEEPGEKGRVVDYRLDKPIVVYDPTSPTVEIQSRWTWGRIVLVALGTLGVLCGLPLLRFLARRPTQK